MPNLLHQTMNSLAGINYWSWSELLSALKQCQDLSSEADSSTISQKIIESLVERLGLPNIATSCTSSSDCSSYRFSTDTRSTESRRTECPNSRTWWFHDLVFLNIYWIGRIVNSMLSREFDHATIIHFLVHYHRSRLIRTDPVERRQIIESVIDLLSLMNQSSLSWKCLSEVFRMSSGSNIRTSQRVLLESLMGSKLDRATLDHLLLPSPNGRSYAYDVDLIRRLASVFFLKGSSSSSSDQQKKVAHLVDSFLLEAAPDFSLPSPRFQSLITIVPEAARESHDKLYQSIDMYLETHNFLGEEQKLEICRALHYEKLPPDALKHFINNMNFPSNLRAEAMQLLTDTQHCLSTARKEDRAMGTRLQGLPPRVLELEKLYTNMQPQKANLTRPQKKSSPLSNSYFPKLCST
ncbi:hypothetical protein SAY87_008799 [Trapa incisa]|uniref:NPH3 domain-containing protein n=1 Tax=Trapa incisa TaxID=236973 RepID=A0AAN7PVN2_9MYRT|nr:hypothetical protein SAY87_008799 [Trapa incisa]